MIRLFACDLDGTLLNQDHESDEIILEAVDQVLESGRQFAIATGRHMHINQIKNLGMHDRAIYTICMNGSLIMDQNQNIIYQKSVNQDFLHEMLTRFPKIDFECIGMNHTYMRTSKEDHIKQFEQRSIWKKVLKKPDISEFLKDCRFNQSNEDILQHEIMKVNCRVEDRYQHDQLMNYIHEHRDIVVNAPFDEGIFEITDKAVNKGEAVARLAQLLHIQDNEVAVYGDGGNDIEMLKRFKYAYATANASEAAKQAAGNVIGHCDEHGVPKHILQIIKN